MINIHESITELFRDIPDKSDLKVLVIKSDEITYVLDLSNTITTILSGGGRNNSKKSKKKIK